MNKGLLAYWSLDEENESEVIEQTSNGLNGSFSGGKIISTDTHPYGTFITGNEGWRTMSSPFENASYNQILDTLWTQGFTGSDSPDNGTSNVLYYDEANRQFTSISNADDIPSAGSGFITYVYDDQDYDGTGDGFPKLVESDSSQASGSVSPGLSFTDTGILADDGWNLVGNPYGSTIIWGATSKPASANLDDSFYVWNESASGGAGDYQSWNSQALPEGWIFTLIDNDTGEEIDIKESSRLSIELEPSEASKTIKTQNLASPHHQVLSPQVMKAKTNSTPRFTLTITSNQAVSNERLAEIPQQVELQQNYPNPFNPTTTIEYGVPETGQVSLEVFDMLGRKVATLINRQTQQAGRYSLQFDAGNLASGLYLYRLQAGNTVITKKLTLIK